MKPASSQAPRGLLREEALQALREAVADVIAEHKRLGMPLIVWRDGKVVEISPEEAESEYNAAKAREEAARAAGTSGNTVP
jgi:phage shock protein A